MKELPANPGQLKAALNKAFGKTWVDWVPECLIAEWKDTFGKKPTRLHMDYIHALRAFLKTNTFFTDANAFENIVLAVNQRDVDPGRVQICLPEEITFALKHLMPMRKDNPGFANEVSKYIQVCCQMDGLMAYPKELSFVPCDKEFGGCFIPNIKPLDVDIEEDQDLDFFSLQSKKLYAIQAYVDAKEGKKDKENQ